MRHNEPLDICLYRACTLLSITVMDWYNVVSVLCPLAYRTVIIKLDVC